MKASSLRSLGPLLVIGALCLAGAALLRSRPEKSPHANANSPRLDSHGSRPADASPRTELLEKLHSLTEPEGPIDFEALQRAVRTLVKADPRAAADFAASLHQQPMRDIVLLRVVQAWAALHPEAAARWADSLRHREERGTLLAGILGEVAQQDPAQALQMAERYDLGTLSPGMTGDLLQRWAERDYEAAQGWAERQTAGKARDEVYLRLATVRSQSAPAEAARMVAERIDSEGIQKEAAIVVISRWAARDEAAAKAWAGSFAAGEFRERALKEISLTAPAER